MIEWKNLRIITDGDVALEQQLFSLYRQTAEGCLKKLSDAVGESNAAWKTAAHEWKGASANIYAEELTQLCYQAERLSDISEHSAMLEKLRHAYQALDAYLTREGR